MNKKELIRAISQETSMSVSQDKVGLILDTAVSVVKRTLEAGEPVKWSGFGTLTVKDIPPKRLYSPVKQEYIVTKGVRKIVFIEPRNKNLRSESISMLE